MSTEVLGKDCQNLPNPHIGWSVASLIALSVALLLALRKASPQTPLYLKPTYSLIALFFVLGISAWVMARCVSKSNTPSSTGLIFTTVWLSVFIPAFTASLVIRSIHITSGSMAPTFQRGDAAITFLPAYGMRFAGKSWKAKRLIRGDIVLLYLSKNTNTLLIKRIVGLPGETVEIRLGRTWINGKPISEPWIQGVDMAYDSLSASNTGPVVLLEDCYFVLGDNRKNSWDSRQFGCVESHHIVAKVIWPFD